MMSRLLVCKHKNLEAVYQDKHFNLVVECKQGNRKAQYELYKLYAKAMFNIAVRILDDDAEAADVLQESFLDAFTRINGFRQETTFGLWIKQIVINRSISRLRKHKFDLVNLEDMDTENIAEPEEYDEEAIQMQVSEIKNAMKLLPDGYRVIISLYLLEGYDHEEIAYVMNISENTSRTQFLRAKRKLRELLKVKDK